MNKLATVLVSMVMFAGGAAFAEGNSKGPGDGKGTGNSDGKGGGHEQKHGGNKEAPKDAMNAGKPAGPPKADEAFTAGTKYMLGGWKCTGTQPAGPWGEEDKYTAKLSFKMELGGFWMSVEGDQKMSKSPMKWMFRGLVGYDAAGKKFTRIDYDNMGNLMHLSSTGWDGDKMVFDGDGMMMGQKMKIRHTMTKKGDKEFTSVFEAAGPDGKFATMADESCKKGK